MRPLPGRSRLRRRSASYSSMRSTPEATSTVDVRLSSSTSIGYCDRNTLRTSSIQGRSSARRFSTLVGGANTDVVYGLALHETTNEELVVLAGVTESSDFPVVNPILDSNIGLRGGDAS